MKNGPGKVHGKLAGKVMLRIWRPIEIFGIA